MHHRTNYINGKRQVETRQLGLNINQLLIIYNEGLVGRRVIYILILLHHIQKFWRSLMNN